MNMEPDYKLRRQKLAQLLPSNSVAIVASGVECIRNGDTHYAFRQNSDFYYLTGFNEPEALLLIYAGDNGESILFNRERDPQAEQWTGPRLGQELACQKLMMHAAYANKCLESMLPELLSGQKSLYYTLNRDLAMDQIILQAYQVARGKRGVIVPEMLCDLQPYLSELRLLKDATEIAYMREAARISVLAHQRAMQKCRFLEYEYELEAEILYELYRHGCRSVAYDSIVAGGANACILHYTDNSHALTQGNLVLIDAGGEYQNYAADITRTYPLNGIFSHEQAQIYSLVLQAQRAGVACIKPGCAFSDIQQAIVQVLTTGLVDLGILQGNVDSLIEQMAYKPFYMHNSGHWLGLDVHDVGSYKIDGQPRLLQPGMTLTVEPGLYLSDSIEGLDPKWWNIGVRIEDDFLVTLHGSENLTGDLVVEKEDVEAYIRG